jgi:hypothetical protein
MSRLKYALVRWWRLTLIDVKYKALSVLEVTGFLLRAAFWVALVVGLAWLLMSVVSWLWSHPLF